MAAQKRGSQGLNREAWNVIRNAQVVMVILPGVEGRKSRVPYRGAIGDSSPGICLELGILATTKHQT